MGPGFFPVAIGCVIALIGALSIVQELLTGNKTEPVALVHLRPLVVITHAVMAFGLLIRPMGLVISVATLVLIGAFGRREIRPLVTLVLIAMSEEHTSELQSPMRASYAVFCLKK